MNIEFSPVDENYIREKVKKGYYSNAAELVCDAVRHMRQQEISRQALLEAALELGEQDIAAGRTLPYTPSLLDQIEQDARQQVCAGKDPHPDVVP
ncbi:MAG: hypothetical protein HQL64_00680 [Magnetococcales bacterium]|nr:hypothetical protein [Magnetococcales bacterium]